MSSNTGKLFVFEGPDGVGKTTLAAKFAEHLTSHGMACDLMSFPGREHGTLGHLVYQLHHDAARFEISSIQPTSLQMLHIAAHIDAIETRILPALSEGQHIVLDRFWWSTWVYGVVAKANRQALRAMIRAERAHWGRIQPSHAFLMARAIPLREMEDGDHWKELCIEYQTLAGGERRRYPVHVIDNDDTVGESLSRIVAIAGMD